VTTLREGNLEHRFDSGWTASKYDEWPFYRKHFDGAFGGNKAVDFVAQDSSETLWLVELKDYRVCPRTKSLELAEEIAVKVRDSLAGLFAAAVWHSDHAHRADAQRHLRARSFRIVLHLEQLERHSKLFPRSDEALRKCAGGLGFGATAPIERRPAVPAPSGTRVLSQRSVRPIEALVPSARNLAQGGKDSRLQTPGSRKNLGRGRPDLAPGAWSLEPGVWGLEPRHPSLVPAPPG
jgi:hypothetical protein